jgi:hypothetical protein
MNEQIKELAEQAGLSREFSVSGLWLADDDELERFSELVRQDERKNCANILESFAEDMENREWSMGAAAMRGAADTIKFKRTNEEKEGEK